MDINKRIGAIHPSLTLGIASRAKAMAAAGETVFNFAAGEPDFDTPENIKEAAVAALNAGCTKYTPATGLPELRRAIAGKLAADNGLEYAPEQIVVGNGGKHCLFNIFMALCTDGAEVVIPAPYWLSYPEMVGVAGGKAVIVPTREDNGFKMTAEDLTDAVTPRTAAVVINSPSNPVGLVYSRSELEALTEIALARGLTIVSDEIYEKMVYDGERHTSIAALSPEAFDNTVTVNGFSKAYAMTGWRLGYLAGPPPLVKAIAALQSHSTSGPNTFAQHGAVAALQQSSRCTDDMLAAFAERRGALYGRLTALDGVTCVLPGGAFYMFPNIARFGMDSVTFAERLLEEAGVAVVPGAAFGADANVRLSYACSMEVIEKGMDAFEQFLARL